MARINTLDNFCTDIANSIRSKKGTTDPILAQDFDTEIASIESGASSDINEYFNTTITKGTSSVSGIRTLLKKIPNDLKVSISGNSIQYMFSNEKTNFIRDSKDFISNLDTSGVTNMSYAFYNGYSSLDISNWDTSNVTTMRYMFGRNSSNDSTAYATLSMNNCDLGKLVDARDMFNYFGTFQLNLTFGKNYGKGFAGLAANYNYLNFSDCKPTHESLMSVINNLYDLNLTYDVSNGGTLHTQKLIFGSANLAKLTQEEIQIATDKGWTIS